VFLHFSHKHREAWIIAQQFQIVISFESMSVRETRVNQLAQSPKGDFTLAIQVQNAGETIKSGKRLNGAACAADASREANGAVVACWLR